MKNNDKWIMLVFALVLILFAVFSTKTTFHDSAEFITIAKYFAGINNVDLFSAHSLVYPVIISLFLKIWPSEIMFRLVNVMWVFLIGMILFFWLNNKKVFLLFAFSPLVWQTSIQTTPVLPATFFFLLSFIFFKKDEIKYNLVYSGLFLGFTFAIYTPMILVAGSFIIVYFWGRSFKEFFIYILALGIGLLPGIALDYYLFHQPFYSFIRYLGANVLVSLGVRASTDFQIFKRGFFILSLLFIISPFLFKIYKLDFKKYSKEIIFIILVALLFVIRIAELKYFIILTPVILLLLSKCLSEKEIKLNAIISIFIIIYLIWGFFGANQEILITKDLKSITNDFKVDYILTETHQAINFARYQWENEPRFIWFQDYEASINNITTTKSYTIGINPKIPLRENLNILFNFDRPSNKSYDGSIIFVVRKDRQEFVNEQEVLAEFKLNKCYEVLCVYSK